MDQDVTRLITAIEGGDERASEELLPLVYDELRRLAQHKMANERAGHTLQATALVHEAYLRLLGPEETGRNWDGRGHFFAAAAEAMRRILIDRARKKQRVRHGGEMQRIPLEDVNLATEADDDTLMLVHEALDKLAEKDPVCAELIKLRFFAGLSHVEAAGVLGLAERTAGRTWAYARAWLHEEIKREI